MPQDLPPSSNGTSGTPLVPTGYGHQTHRRYLFNGNSSQYHTWYDRFLMSLDRVQDNLSAVVISGEGTPSAADNKIIYRELAESIDDTSFNLINKTALKNKGKESLALLSKHYLGNEEERVFTALKSLLSIQKATDEKVTPFFARLSLLKATLEDNKVVIPEAIYLLMSMRGLTPEFKLFADILDTPRTRPKYEDFEALCRLKESELEAVVEKDSVMKARSFQRGGNQRGGNQRGASGGQSDIICFKCRQTGHKAPGCRNPRVGVWCHKCKSDAHSAQACTRFRDLHQQPARDTADVAIHRSASVRVVDDGAIHNVDSDEETQDFVFSSNLYTQGVEEPQQQLQQVGEVSSMIKNYDWSSWSSGSTNKGMSEEVQSTGGNYSPITDSQGHVRSRVTSSSFIVDSGATNHIVNSLTHLKTLNISNEKHYIGLADGTFSLGKVKGYGKGMIKIKDLDGRLKSVILKNVLYMPEFSNNFFSVKAATKHGATFNFKEDSATLTKSNINFPLDASGDLYHLKVQ